MDENNTDNSLEESYIMQHQVVEVRNVFNDDKFYIEMPVQYMLPKKNEFC